MGETPQPWWLGTESSKINIHNRKLMTSPLSILLVCYSCRRPKIIDIGRCRTDRGEETVLGNSTFTSGTHSCSQSPWKPIEGSRGAWAKKRALRSLLSRCSKTQGILPDPFLGMFDGKTVIARNSQRSIYAAHEKSTRCDRKFVVEEEKEKHGGVAWPRRPRVALSSLVSATVTALLEPRDLRVSIFVR